MENGQRRIAPADSGCEDRSACSASDSEEIRAERMKKIMGTRILFTGDSITDEIVIKKRTEEI